MGLNAAARHEFAAAERLRGPIVEVPEVTVLVHGARWALLDSGVLPTEVVAVPLEDGRFPGALATDGTRVVPLPVAAIACLDCELGSNACFRCEERCDDPVSFGSSCWLCDGAKRLRCQKCFGRLATLPPNPTSSSRTQCCDHPWVVREKHVAPFEDTFLRCETCGLATILLDSGKGTSFHVACECGFLDCACA